jgi:hypothetical protein
MSRLSGRNRVETTTENGWMVPVLRPVVNQHFHVIGLLPADYFVRCMSLVLCRFSDAGNDNLTTRSGGRRGRKPPRHEIASAGSAGRGRGLYMATRREVKSGRLATAMRREQQHNLSGMARILLLQMGISRFVSPVISMSQNVAKKSTQQLLRDQLHNEPWTIARTGARKLRKPRHAEPKLF